MSEQLDKTQRDFEVLAPYYLEILDKLSGNEALKFVFYSTNGFLDSFDSDYRLRLLMQEKDEDIKRWSEQESERKHELWKQEQKEKDERHFALRADLKMDELIEYVDIEGKTYMSFKNIARVRLIDKFDAKEWWYPELIEFRDRNDELEAYAIIGRNNGATGWMIGYDKGSEMYCFGSRVHRIGYDSEKKKFIGCLGAGKYELDAMGRNAFLDEFFRKSLDR